MMWVMPVILGQKKTLAWWLFWPVEGKVCRFFTPELYLRTFEDNSYGWNDYTIKCVIFWSPFQMFPCHLGVEDIRNCQNPPNCIVEALLLMGILSFWFTCAMSQPMGLRVHGRPLLVLSILYPQTKEVAMDSRRHHQANAYQSSACFFVFIFGLWTMAAILFL